MRFSSSLWITYKLCNNEHCYTTIIHKENRTFPSVIWGNVDDDVDKNL